MTLLTSQSILILHFRTASLPCSKPLVSAFHANIGNRPIDMYGKAHFGTLLQFLYYIM